MTPAGGTCAEVDGRGRLADTALLVGDCVDGGQVESEVRHGGGRNELVRH